VAAAALTALSSVIGRQVGLRPKRHDDWQIVPNLFGAVVGQPGVLKTPAVQEALGPLRRLESEAHEEYEFALQQYEVSHLVAKARAEAAKDKLKRSAKKGATEQELRALAQDAAGDETDDAPVWRRHMVNDTTVEKLGELLRDNPNGLLLFRDELTGFFKTMDRQGHESDRAFYLEGWNGTGSYTYDRIGRGTVIIPSVCLSLFGTIQPGPLARHLRRGGQRGRGRRVCPADADDGLPGPSGPIQEC
jgi:putative DNA primase/helicase